MAEANSTLTKPHTKARKLVPWLHKASGRWCLTRKGRRYYLGRTEEEANSRLKRYRKLIERGLAIPEIGHDDANDDNTAAPTVKNGCLAFLKAQKTRADMNDLSQRSLQDYVSTCQLFTEFVGEQMWIADLKPEHFLDYKAEIAKRRNIVGVGNEVTRVKTVFKWLYENDLIPIPVRFGTDFRRPTKKSVRLHRHRNNSDDLFTRDQLLSLTDELGVHWRAMAFLGINAGFKNADVAELRNDEVDFEKGMIHSIRTKSGEYRVTTLWPETLDALKLSISRRPIPSEGNEDRFFVLPDGNAINSLSHDIVGTRFRGALQRLKIHRPGMNFSWVRSTFRTVADEIGDDRAVAWIMGHADDRVARDYIKRAPIDRIRKVTEHVRQWLLGGVAK